MREETDPLAVTTDGAVAATAVADSSPTGATVASDVALGATVESEQETRALPLDLELPTIDHAVYTERRLLAEGGMGKVVLARDTRLGRRVAIKELRVDNAATRARFEREAALTARLEHPGIVGIHEAGRWPSGEPFFAMRVIAGRALDKLFAEKRDRNGRLALLPNILAVADAVAYAHQEGVIHRDLKPHNVMVGEFGETVVIDWGLAKHVADDTVEAATDAVPSSGDLTVAGAVVGTPMYLPPEQARGGAVDRTADVYAIGAIMYELLVGKPPYVGKTANEILDAVIDGPPAPLPDDVAPELTAIVTRAMAREKADRYQSARELAEDLRRFQTGQLVGAHRYTMRDLFARWVRKRRAILATIVVAVIAVAVIGGISVGNIMAERREARSQRAKAEDLVNYMQRDLKTQLETLNRLDLMEPIARKVIEHRAAQAGNDDASRIELAEAHHDLLVSLLAKAKLDQAEVAVDAAVAALDRMEKPSRKLQHYRSVFTNIRGDVHVNKGDARGAIAFYREALAIVEALHRAEPTKVSWRLDIQYGEGKLADALTQTGDVDGALAAVRRAAAVLENVTGTVDSDQKLLARARAKVSQRLGEMLGRTGDSKAAIEELLRAKTLAEQVAAYDKSWPAQRDVGIVLQRLAFARTAVGDYVGALADLRAGLELASRLADADPANLVLQRDLVVTNSQIAASLTRTKDFAGARGHAAKSLELAEAIAARAPTNAKSQNDIANAVDRLAGAELKLDHVDRAVELADRAVAIRASLVAKDPTNVEWRDALSSSHLRLATILLDRKDFAKAKTSALAALEIARGLADANPSNPEYQRDLSVILSRSLRRSRRLATKPAPSNSSKSSSRSRRSSPPPTPPTRSGNSVW